jgi:hypothetical protein
MQQDCTADRTDRLESRRPLPVAPAETTVDAVGPSGQFAGGDRLTDCVIFERYPFSRLWAIW